MSESSDIRLYAENRIKEILKEVDEHPGKARKKVIAEAINDPRLLLALTQGHLTGIASLWVSRVATRMHREPTPVPETPASLDMSESTFGREILNAIQSGNAPEFSKEYSAPRVGRKQASQAHINALHQIAKSSKSKKD